VRQHPPFPHVHQGRGKGRERGGKEVRETFIEERSSNTHLYSTRGGRVLWLFLREGGDYGRFSGSTGKALIRLYIYPRESRLLEKRGKEKTLISGHRRRRDGEEGRGEGKKILQL